MPNDYVKKEPTKTEKMVYELFLQHQETQRSLWSTSSVVMALAVLAKVDPKQLAETIMDDNRLKEFSKQVNDHIKALEEAKHKNSDSVAETKAQIQ